MNINNINTSNSKIKKDTEIIIMEIPKTDSVTRIPEGAKILGTMDSHEKKDKINKFLDGITSFAAGTMQYSGQALESLGKKVSDKRKLDREIKKSRYLTNEFGSNEDFAGLDEFIDDEIFLNEESELYPVNRYTLPTIDQNKRFVYDKNDRRF